MNPWPWPEQNGRIPDGDERYDARTIRVYAVLDTWFRAMEDGTAEFWQPDPAYVRPGGKPPLTEDQLDRLVRVQLDEWFEQGSNANYARTTRGIWHDAGPGFSRLALPQREALAQQLEQALKELI